MRNTPNVKAERYRNHSHHASSLCSGTNAGAFTVLSCNGRSQLAVIVSDGGGWDHVSVHVFGEKRCPTWEEMCAVKDLFFRDDEVVMQLHPAKSEYVNQHPFTLHLWRPQTVAEQEALEREFGPNPLLPVAERGSIPLPPLVMV